MVKRLERDKQVDYVETEDYIERKHKLTEPFLDPASQQETDSSFEETMKQSE